MAGADPRGQESGESNPSFPDGEKPTTCSQQRRVSSEPQASTSSDGSWSARGARDLASKSSRADRDPEVFAKKGPGKVRGLSRRSASRQIPCLALRSFPLQPSLQQPRCFPPPAACHFRWPGCRSWLFAPPRELRAPDHKKPSCKREAARWDNSGRQQEIPHERSPATCPGCCNRGNASPRWARQAAANKATAETTTQGPEHLASPGNGDKQDDKTDRAGGDGSGENTESHPKGRTRRGSTQRRRPGHDKQTQKRKEA